VKAQPVGLQPLCIRIVAARTQRSALEAVEFGGLHQAGVYRSISQDACVSSRKTVAASVCILAVGAVCFAGRNDGGPEWKVES
jgi:hypothetical protein